MTSKHWALVGGAVACLFSVFSASQVSASPWVEPGDAHARFKLQQKADSGDLKAATSTWPFMKADIEQGQVPPSNNEVRGIIEVGGTSEPSLIGGFEDKVQDPAELKAGVEWDQSRWSARIKASVAANPDDNEQLRFDDSYLAGTLGNWMFGIGAIDRWWGPGWQNSLILSNNARPLPQVWLNRNQAIAPDVDWLKWIGPWRFTMFVGEMEEERFVSSPVTVGMRLETRPFNSFDIGLSRILMLGGEGRSVSASTVWDALIGNDNREKGEVSEPGNQLASVDARYGFVTGERTMGVYAQMMGEDEAGAFPARKSWLFGLDWTSGIGRGEQQWFLEYVNTIADDFVSDAIPNVTYEHGIYKSGFRYYGRSMGASVDGDAEGVSLGGYHFMGGGDQISVTLTYADLNVDGSSRVTVTDPDVQYFVPTESQVVGFLSVGYGGDVFGGHLKLQAQIADTEIQIVNRRLERWSVGGRWQYEF
ncbi:capsule assembly Wzi family protein [Marinobacter sediminum]|uniref:capsule assembly Wzi family protein n=1 Tax=Marinobacter sediminum TaxID=256323 RepID=UPI00202EEDEB|nr:capsule assembly Wzi family protein [Marinobacter sediminum]MCM0612649.1 capsule assembly Wzi family protein [Marinobacter sediminum]